MSQGQVEYSSLSRLVSIIQFERSHAPEVLIQQYMLEAANDLAEACIGTLEIDMEGDQNTIDYEFGHCIPDGLELASVAYVRICGICVYPYEKCHPCPNGWQLRSETCIRIQPCPPEKFQICLVLRPTEACSSLPKCFARHRNYLHYAVSGRLALQTDEKWGNANEARYNLRRAEGYLKSAAVREVRGHSSAPRNNDKGGGLI